MSAHPWEEMPAPYALGVLEAEEREQFEAHLAECGACRHEVAGFEEVTGLLAHAAPPVALPAALRERILTAARREQTELLAVSEPAENSDVDIRPAPRSARRGGGWNPGWWVAAASVVLAIAAGLGYRQEREERIALQRTVGEARAAVEARDSLLATLLEPGVRAATLTATGEPPSVQIFWNPQRAVVLLAVTRLPPAGPGRSYQLWGIEGDRPPVSLGTFATDAEGRASVVLPVPEGVSFDVSAVTEEPAGGSPQPTTTPFLVGGWGAAS